jgi:hypothetical protein
LIVSYTLFYEEISKGYKMMILFVIPCFGAYFIYSSLQTGIILNLTYSRDRKEKLPLREIVKSKRLREFELLLRAKSVERVITLL